MKESSVSAPGSNRKGAIIFSTLTVLFVYMIWLQLTGRPMPEWLLWATTIF
jgi:hypothetical protein